MRYTEILLEMPQLIDATDFGLMDPQDNLALTDKLMSAKDKEILRETNDYILFRTGLHDGNIALIDKTLNQTDYWVRFRTLNKKLVGKSVTQVAIWRRLGSPWVQGVTQEIFFDYLLLNWPTIMSDGLQTERGKEFWINIMAQATVKDFSVGVVDFNLKTVEWFRREEKPFQTWIAEQQVSWTDQQTARAVRFMVSI